MDDWRDSRRQRHGVCTRKMLVCEKGQRASITSWFGMWRDSRGLTKEAMTVTDSSIYQMLLLLLDTILLVVCSLR